LNKPENPISEPMIMVETDSSTNEKTISVQLVTDADGNIVTTASEIKNLIELNTIANSLVTVSYISGNDGT